MKKYALNNPQVTPSSKFNKRTQAVFEALKGGEPKTAKEIHVAMGGYTLGGVYASLAELRKAGILADESSEQQRPPNKPGAG
jgi:hypothetical protein